MDWSQFVAECLPAAHTVTMEALAGAGPDGDVWSDPVDETECYAEQKQRRVRVATQDASGAEVLGSSTVYGPISMADSYPVGSMATTPWGDRRRVLRVDRFTAAGLPLPEHAELVLE